MGASKIAKAIKKSCDDDIIMRNFLMDLLEFTRTGKTHYKDYYKDLIKEYVKKTGEKYED